MYMNYDMGIPQKLEGYLNDLESLKNQLDLIAANKRIFYYSKIHEAEINIKLALENPEAKDKQTVDSAEKSYQEAIKLFPHRFC